MARGAYDTTGVPKPRTDGASTARPPPAPARPAASASQQTHERQQPNILELPWGPIDVDPPSPGPDELMQDTVPQSAASQERFAELTAICATTQPADTSAQHDDKEGRPSRFTDEQKAILDLWMVDNQDTPYTTQASKCHLVKMTGLSEKQVQQYLSNYRRRLLEKSGLSRVASLSSLDLANHSSSRSDVIETDMAAPPAADSPKSTDADAPGASIEARPPSRHFSETPASPVSQQGSHADAQSEVVESGGPAIPKLAESHGSILTWWMGIDCDSATNDDHSDVPPMSRRQNLHHDDPPDVLSGAVGPSQMTCRTADDDMMSTTESLRSGNESLQPIGGSIYSTGSFTSRGSRRGRRAYGNFLKPSLPTSRSGAEHECEQCGNSFARASTLKRHLSSVHETSERWVCSPVTKSDGALLCPTCLKDPITCEHGMLRCWEKSEEHRTFYRKDLLRQHLKLVHDFDSGAASDDVDILGLLRVDLHREGLNTALQRLAVPLVRTKLACYEWSIQEHSLTREAFEQCWVSALTKALAVQRSCEDPIPSSMASIVEHFRVQIHELEIEYL